MARCGVLGKNRGQKNRGQVLHSNIFLPLYFGAKPKLCSRHDPPCANELAGGSTARHLPGDRREDGSPQRRRPPPTGSPSGAVRRRFNWRCRLGAR